MTPAMPILPRDYQPPTDLLKDRIILITGAGDGIGKAAALTCALHRATVILLGKTVRKLEQVYDDIVACGAPPPAIYPFNLETASPDDYHQLAEILNKEYGRLDGLLLNAGLLGNLTPIVHYDPQSWARVLHINLTANFLLTRECFQVLKKSRDARVLFTSDAAAIKGTAYWGAYAVAKAGGDTLMRILADEWETNTAIRVNSLDPGIVQTTLRRHAFPAEDPSRLATPHAIMPAYLYLLGPDSQALHGQRLVWSA